MSVVRDPWRKVYTLVTACETCGAPIYYSDGTVKRRTAWNVDEDGRATIDKHGCPKTTRPTTKKKVAS